MRSKRFICLIWIIYLPLSLFANPSKNATLISHWPEVPCLAVHVAGNYAYLASGNALQI